MSDNAWPVLNWTPSEKRLSWLSERTKELAQRARAFELALEESTAAGEAPLSKAADPLGEWEHTVANVWMYAGLEGAKKFPPEDVPLHAEELAKIYGTLQKQRAEILKALGPDAAAKVVAREKTVKVDDAQIKLRVGELPAPAETSALGAMSAPTQYVEPPETPITADELKSRDAAERKTLPDDADFKTLLGLQPPVWVNAIFETHGLLLPLGEDEDDEVELTANSRTTMQKKLLAEKMGDALLREAVFALEDDDRKLIEELIASNGAVRYADARTKYGKDDADGFQWSDRPPSGTVAKLRRLGIAFVGMRGGKQILAMPKDVTAVLKKLLESGA